MQARRSLEPHRRSSSSLHYLNGHGDREGLIRNYDVEQGAFGLSELAEESDGEPGPTYKESADDVKRSTQQAKYGDDLP